jgi:2-polyprenyl-6-methoxyphenol hydroxylase-like FAD-dependent oxidoreductase/ketosteroid isomerase-like protein
MHGKERLDAAIVGAGFAGLALGCHLAERGRAVCVLERRPDIRSGGAAILLQPNGLAALDRLGVLEPVLAAGSRIDRYRLRDLQDRELASYDWGELPHRHPFLVAIRRADVAAILAQRMAQLGAGAPRTACEFQDLVREGDRVRGLRYRDRDGREHELRSACVVGADGAGSRVRSALGIRATRVSRPDSYVVGFGRLPPETTPNEAVIYCGPGFGDGVVPLGGQVLFWDHVTAQNRTAVEAQDLTQWRALYGRRVPNGLDITDGIASWDELIVFTVRTQLARRRTADGAALAGDAAATVHPHTAQGANLALEDAVALGELLSGRRSREAVTRAELGRYERDRHRKALRYVLWSPIAARNIDAPNAGWRAMRTVGHYSARVPPLRRAALRTTAGLVGARAPRTGPSPPGGVSPTSASAGHGGRDTRRAMSQQGVEGVRQPLSARDRSRRAPEEWLAPRLPRLFDLGSRFVFGLPPGSRIRRALLRRAVCVGQATYNRREFESLLPLYHPDVEVHSPKEWVELGDFDPVYRGHEGLIRFYRQWADAWADNRAEPQELIDLGDRLVLLGEIQARGSASGIEVGRRYAMLWHIRGGKITREQVFNDPAEALETVGLPEQG